MTQDQGTMDTGNHIPTTHSKPPRKGARRPKVSEYRRNLLKMIHIPVSHGRITENERREFIFERFDERSSKLLSDDQLAEVVDDMRAAGWLDGRGAGGSQADDRPSPKQWAYLAGLCIKRGWKKHRLASKGLRTWVSKHFDIASPRFMTQRDIVKVIYALEQWTACSPEEAEPAEDEPALDMEDTPHASPDAKQRD